MAATCPGADAAQICEPEVIHKGRKIVDRRTRSRPLTVQAQIPCGAAQHVAGLEIPMDPPAIHDTRVGIAADAPQQIERRPPLRSDERCEGKEGVRRCRTRWSP